MNRFQGWYVCFVNRLQGWGVLWIGSKGEMFVLWLGSKVEMFVLWIGSKVICLMPLHSVLFCDLFVHPYWTNLHGTCNQTSTWFQVTVAAANWGAHAVLSSARVLPGGHHRLPALCLAVSICVVNWEDITGFLLIVLPWVSVLLTGRTSQTSCSLSCHEYLCC